MKKKKILTMILSILGIIVLGVAIIIATKPFKPKYDGLITIEVIGLDNEVIKTKEIGFTTEDTLIALVEDNFDNVLIENGMIMAIEGYQTPSDWSTFLSIYVDDEMSMVGIADIEFKDGTVISFVITEFVM